MGAPCNLELSNGAQMLIACSFVVPQLFYPYFLLCVCLGPGDVRTPMEVGREADLGPRVGPALLFGHRCVGAEIQKARECQEESLVPPK